MKILRRPDTIPLTTRLDALATAIDFAQGTLPPDVLSEAETVVDRSRQRHELSLAHTVVALAGATGSGKSSLFNALSGMDISRVGVRRPTTSEPVACVWGTVGVAPLLDWLGVPRRHQIARESVLDSGEQDEFDGLVLIDLPDYDSTHREHRGVVEHFVEMVDLFVWVLDPQKYADAALHDEYLKPLAEHRAVTLVVLNQVDRLSADELQQCLSDLRRLLVEDGLDRVPVLPVSARTGQGLGDLGDLLRGAVSRRKAVDERIAADARAAANALHEASGNGEPGSVGSATRRDLIDALVGAAGVDAVADAVEHAYAERSQEQAGWPVYRWIRRRRPDPAGRLGLDHSPPSELVSSSVPAPTPVQRAPAESAVRTLGDAAAGSAAGPWRNRIRDAAAASSDELPDALDQAVVSTDLQLDASPVWWRLTNAVQWLAFGAAAVGLLWLLVSTGASFFERDFGAFEVRGLPVSVVLLVGGVVVGLIIAAIARWAGRHGAHRRADQVRKSLRAAITSTADEVVMAPVEAELDRYRGFVRALTAARS